MTTDPEVWITIMLPLIVIFQLTFRGWKLKLHDKVRVLRNPILLLLAIAIDAMRSLRWRCKVEWVHYHLLGGLIVATDPSSLTDDRQL
jgi:hypothetical protein